MLANKRVVKVINATEGGAYMGLNIVASKRQLTRLSEKIKQCKILQWKTNMTTKCGVD